MSKLRIEGNMQSGDPDSGYPLKIGGVARTTNPTAVNNTERIDASFDDVGRQLVMPVQVRDLISTASATLTTGSASTLLAAGGSGVFTDLIHATFANNSTASATVALLQDGTTIKTLQIPAGNTLVFEPVRPIPAVSANTVWTVDMEDITGTTVNVNAIFSQEI